MRTQQPILIIVQSGETSIRLSLDPDRTSDCDASPISVQVYIRCHDGRAAFVTDYCSRRSLVDLRDSLEAVEAGLADSAALSTMDGGFELLVKSGRGGYRLRGKAMPSKDANLNSCGESELSAPASQLFKFSSELTLNDLRAALLQLNESLARLQGTVIDH
ncbi:MAG TPA: hypothetical protein VFI31_26970 [Pirellulales bacterium]|nr:hypothetical protein [Pirellulales bacterium]